MVKCRGREFLGLGIARVFQNVIWVIRKIFPNVMSAKKWVAIVVEFGEQHNQICWATK